MSVLSIVGDFGYLVAAAAILFAARCYVELRSWARQCQGARIIIAYNNRVKLQAPLTEWLLWTRGLGEDERSSGRVIYQANKVRIAIAAPPPKAPAVSKVKRVVDTWKMVRSARPSRKASAAPAKS
jgi:hypothetical protein